MRSLNKLTITKYADLSDHLLRSYCSHPYTSGDVVKLASALIDYDVDRAAQFDQVEYLTKCGQHIAHGFLDELAAIGV